MTAGRTTVIAIIGGGASGVLLAAHLMRLDDPDLRVFLIERRPRFGEGMAYSTSLPDHVLNISAYGMSALADEPEHFHDWLNRQGPAGGDGPVYAPRSLYATYLRELLDTAVSRYGPSGRINLVHETCDDIAPTPGGIEVRLANGTSIAAHCAVIATGHDEEAGSEHHLALRPRSRRDTALAPDASVLILGTGLSMVDAWLELRGRGHRGPITALSRRGLVPHAHRQGRAVRFDQADIPLGTELSYFFAWLKDRLEEARSRGLGWRDVIDGLRPFSQAIWQSWPASARRRFLEHTKPWWDVHRHRVAPAIHRRLADAIETGDIAVLAGRVRSIVERDGRLDVAYRLRQTGGAATITVDRVYDCTGIVRDVSTGSDGVVRTLVDRGLGRPDPLKLGLDVTSDCAVIGGDGRPSDRLFAVGPLTRGTFFEIEAIPDIRLQCAALARHLAGSNGP